MSKNAKPLPARDSGWIALRRTEETNTLLAKHPNAFLQLCQIGLRAKWKDDPISGLREGEAFVGDFWNAGIETEMKYRHAKKILVRCGLATFRGTNKGTVATLVNSSIFSLSEADRNEQITTKQRPSNEQGTSNKTDKTEIEGTHTLVPPSAAVENEQPSLDLQGAKPDVPGIVALYPRRENVMAACAAVHDHLRRGFSPEAIIAGTRAIADVIQQLPGKHLNRYVPGAERFFLMRRWEDDPQTWLRGGANFNGAPGKLADIGGRRNTGTVIKIPPMKPTSNP